MSDFPPLSPEALQKLEKVALEHMEHKRFAEALVLWEMRLRSGETGLAPFPLYALCLAEVGRVDEAKVLCERTSRAIEGLPPGERRDQLMQLLARVVVQLPGMGPAPGAPLPSPEAEALFGGAGPAGPDEPEEREGEKEAEKEEKP